MSGSSKSQTIGYRCYLGMHLAICHGPVDAAFGQAAQTPNDYLVSKIGSPQPAYRGILSLILRQVYIAANNPYMKPWAVRVKRCFRD